MRERGFDIASKECSRDAARLFAEASGAISYGPDLASVSGRGALLVAKILAGAKPGELPVERPTKVQLIVNLKTTKALGLAYQNPFCTERMS